MTCFVTVVVSLNKENVFPISDIDTNDASTGVMLSVFVVPVSLAAAAGSPQSSVLILTDLSSIAKKFSLLKQLMFSSSQNKLTPALISAEPEL